MITLSHTTFGRTPLDEWSVRRRDLYQATHNTHNRQTSMPPVGFKPTIPVGQGLLINEDSWSHSDTPQSVGLLWTSDQLVAEASTRQHTTFTTDRHPCPRWDSNPQSQQASGRRPTSWTARPHTTRFSIQKFYVLNSECIYLFWKCELRCRNWSFEYNSG